MKPGVAASCCEDCAAGSGRLVKIEHTTAAKYTNPGGTVRRRTVDGSCFLTILVPWSGSITKYVGKHFIFQIRF